jgi:hypothetical protein
VAHFLGRIEVFGGSCSCKPSKLQLITESVQKQGTQVLADLNLMGNKRGYSFPTIPTGIFPKSPRSAEKYLYTRSSEHLLSWKWGPSIVNWDLATIDGVVRL